MRRIQRQILRDQGYMMRMNGHFPARYLRSWCPTVVGSEKNPSTPGPGWKWRRKSIVGITGKQHRRNRIAQRLLERELIESGGAM